MAVTMTKRLFNPASLAAVVLSLAGVALSACSPDPYPTPVAEEPPPPPPAELAGGPELPPSPPMETAPLPPPPPAEQAAAPVPAPPVIIAMAPIPNPPEEPRRARRRGHTHEIYSAAPSAGTEGVYTYASPEPRRAVTRRQRTHRRAAAAHPPRLALAKPAPRVPSKPAEQVPAKPTSKPAAVSRSPGKVTPPANVARNAKPSVPALKPPAAPVAAAPAAPGTFHAAQLKNLETALAEAVSKTAKLTAPSKLEPGMPAEVSLALPAEFADTVKAEAEKTGLGDAASSVNLTAVLSGEGYVVMPDETQSLPLVTGKPTQFRWSVTPGAAAKGPLKADLGADLLGGGSDTLNLGAVSSSNGLDLGNNPLRLVGYGIFAVIAAALIAWLLRGRNTPPPRSTAQRRTARRAVRNDKPFDLGDERA
jgi:hypothetical protein